MYPTTIQLSVVFLLVRVNVKSGQFNPPQDGDTEPTAISFDRAGALTTRTSRFNYLDTLPTKEIIKVKDNDRVKEFHDYEDAKAKWVLHKPGSQTKFEYSTLYRPNVKEDEEVSSLDPVFNEILDVGKRNNSKRGALDLYKMVKCGTGCNPLVYKGYGCYCGFLGSGGVVDGIDRCCKMHDWCYSQTTCMHIEYHLPYFFPYKWTCNGGAPYCIAGSTKKTNSGSCSHQLCECDREFVECLKEFPCPHKKAMCRSPWRYWQNLFMGLGTGMEMGQHRKPHRHHRFKPTLFKPRSKKNRFESLFG